MASASSTSLRRNAGGSASPWRAVVWSLQPAHGGSPLVAAYAAWAAVRHAKPLRRWLAQVEDLRSRGLLQDARVEALRALHPPLVRGMGFAERVSQLLDHQDWMEGAFQRAPFGQLARGESVLLQALEPPSGCDSMVLQLRRAPQPGDAGELLLTLTVLPSVGPGGLQEPVDVGVLAFTRLRLREHHACLAIGGVRGQRGQSSQLSGGAVQKALNGWPPAVFLVMVIQELARHWHLGLVGLDPRYHRLLAWPWRWSRSQRAVAKRLTATHAPLWEQFGASSGHAGWLRLQTDPGDLLAATAREPLKRQRQAERADFWLRARGLLRDDLEHILARPRNPKGVGEGSGPGHTRQPAATHWDSLA